MEGQINLEFLTAAMLYIIALSSIFLVGDQVLPSFHSETERTSLNLEAKTFTYEILTHPGQHENGDNWEDVEIDEIESFGLANDFFEVNRDKIERLSTVGDEDLNYTTFRELNSLEHQYHFRFTWMPVVHTNESFTRGESPDFIEEPCPEDPDHTCPSGYNDADDTVTYGSAEIEGMEHTFLATAEDGSYNSLYISHNWDFSDRNPYYSRESFDKYTDSEYTIESFQNREEQEGSVVILKDEINQFGPSPDTTTAIQRVERFAVMEDEPLLIEVLVW